MKNYYITRPPITCGSCRSALGFWHGVCIEHFKVIHKARPACFYYVSKNVKNLREKS